MIMKQVAYRLPEFNGFDFPEYPIGRSKEPVAFIMVRGGRFPLVVLESGFSERESSLVRDAQLWLYGGHAAVKFAVIVIITERSPFVMIIKAPGDSWRMAKPMSCYPMAQKFRRMTTLSPNRPYQTNCNSLAYCVVSMKRKGL